MSLASFLYDPATDLSSRASLELKIVCNQWDRLTEQQRRAIIKSVETAAQSAWLRMELLGERAIDVKATIRTSQCGSNDLRVKPEQEEDEDEYATLKDAYGAEGQG